MSERIQKKENNRLKYCSVLTEITEKTDLSQYELPRDHEAPNGYEQICIGYKDGEEFYVIVPKGVDIIGDKQIVKSEDPVEFTYKNLDERTGKFNSIEVRVKPKV